MKSVLLPIMLFLYGVFPAQDTVTRRVVRLCVEFFWSSRVEKLRRVKVVKGSLQGGKGVECIERFLAVKYVC